MIAFVIPQGEIDNLVNCLLSRSLMPTSSEDLLLEQRSPSLHISRMAQNSRSRRRAALLIVIALIVFLTFRTSFSNRIKPPTTENHGQFWSSFHKTLVDAAPNCNSPTRIEADPGSDGFDPEDVDQALPENTIVEKEDIEKLKNAHTFFIEALAARDAPKLAYQPGTRGIVATVGGSHLPVFLTSLHMLRQTGSTLPVELFIADMNEYDEYVCDTLLPTLNARCIILENILQHSPLEKGLEKYQFKVFSLLFSSFEDVFFLDADAFPIRDPSYLFTSKPFMSTGLVTWSDFWKVSYHSSYFEVSSQPLPTSFPYPSTESGQMLVSKKTHSKMLLLAAYYNFYGPSHYYILLTQGHAGEGDKETFLASARKLDLPFYSTKTGPAIYGYRHAGGAWEGGVMLQPDPVWDSELPPDVYYQWHNKPGAPPSSFVTYHANVPKLEPTLVFGESGRAWTPEGDPRRMWETAEKMIERTGADIERSLWTALESTACVLEGKYHPWDDKPKLCERIHQFITDMSGR